MIALEEAGRIYGEGAGRAVALDRVTLAVKPGRFTAVAGPSGSGKTTLLNLIGAIDEPTSGVVRIDGVSLTDLSDARRADFRLKRVGFIFQHFNLVPVLSAAENVELPLLFRHDIPAAARRDRVEAMMERVGLTAASRRLPGELSGGERQRVAVARALAGEPDIVLADEPTASLDHETGQAVIELMRALNREKGTTFLYATHDPELIAMAEEVIRLRDGRLAGSGEPAGLRGAGGLRSGEGSSGGGV